MGNNKPAVKNKAFLDRIRKGKASTNTASKSKIDKAINNQSRPRLLFSMDATASREHSWEIAQEITSSMFDEVPGELDVALAYHGGGYLKNISPFKSNAKQFKDAVSVVRCNAGPTALNAILSKACEVNGLKALIYIGDCFEESYQEAEYYARQLKLKGTRAFMFIEGYDCDAKFTFSRIAEITGGALLDFDESAPGKIADLLKAISVFVVGGTRLLGSKRNELQAAQVLLDAMK